MLDIGSGNGKMFSYLGNRISWGVGIDPDLPGNIKKDNFVIVQGTFPKNLSPDSRFDVVTLLAVIEHIPPNEQVILSGAIYKHLVPGGKVIITVPSPRVDNIISWLQRLKLAEAKTLFQHYGFDPQNTVTLFPQPFYNLTHSSKFELGLNNIFVFEKSVSN